METSLPSLLLQLLHGFALWLLSSVHIALAIAVTLHALMKKDEVHAAVGWIGLAWLAPFGGALAYWLLGINRIGRTGVALGLRKAWQSEGDLAEVQQAGEPEVEVEPDAGERIHDRVLADGGTQGVLEYGYPIHVNRSSRLGPGCPGGSSGVGASHGLDRDDHGLVPDGRYPL